MMLSQFAKRLLLCCAAALSCTANAQPADPVRAETLELERVAMIVRHGIRAPLADEAPVGDMARQPWPAWPVPESHLTARGAEGMRLLGVYDRAALVQRRLLSATGCPAPGTIRIRSSTAQRAIASGEALADGLAPGCGLPVAHLQPGAVDPIFNPVGAGAVAFDGMQAAAAIERHNGGVRRLAESHRDAFRTLERVLGCRTSANKAGACDILREETVVRASTDGRGIDFSGPIRTASGTAQVFLLQYAEGFDPAQIGWGRADAAAIETMGTLHALLFDVHVRPPYMAARQTAVLGRHMLAALEETNGPKLDLVVGHDNNLNGLAAVLDVHFKVDGYARDDAAVGAALVLELLRDPAGSQRYVRVVYQSQTLDQLRSLAPLTLASPPAYVPLRVPGCALPGSDLCRLEDFRKLMLSRLAPLTTPTDAPRR